MRSCERWRSVIRPTAATVLIAMPRLDRADHAKYEPIYARNASSFASVPESDLRLQGYPFRRRPIVSRSSECAATTAHGSPRTFATATFDHGRICRTNDVSDPAATLAIRRCRSRQPSTTARQVAEISSLLDSLDEAAAESGQSLADKRASAHENKLVQARLGMASGLHAALRAKHPPTASHCLRVALGCSSWAASDGARRRNARPAGSRRAAARRRQDRRAGQSAAEAGPAAAGRNRADVAPRGAARSKSWPAAACRKRCSKSFTTAAPGTTATASRRIARATSCRWRRACCRSSTRSTR